MRAARRYTHAQGEILVNEERTQLARRCMCERNSFVRAKRWRLQEKFRCSVVSGQQIFFCMKQKSRGKKHDLRKIAQNSRRECRCESERRVQFVLRNHSHKIIFLFVLDEVFSPPADVLPPRESANKKPG